jgi:proline iminopeptidase
MPDSRIGEGFIPVPGGRVWYRLAGSQDAAPLVALHGGPGFPHDYIETLQGLARRRPVIFYDQLGCGRSERPEDPGLWVAERFVRELAQVREWLGLRRFHLFGHSWGSMLAADYALTRPLGLASLILASPPLSMSRWIADLTEYRKALPRQVQEILDRHEAAGTTDSEEYAEGVMAFYRRHLCRLDPWPECLERALEGAGMNVYNHMWGPSEFYVTGNLRGYERAERLGEIDIPTLFTCGRYDEATPEATAWYRGLVPGAEMAVFDHSAHMPHLEETGPYLELVGEFLERAERR